MRHPIAGMTPGASARLLEDFGALAEEARAIRDSILTEDKRDELRDLALRAAHGDNWFAALEIARREVADGEETTVREACADVRDDVLALERADYELRLERPRLDAWLADQARRRDREVAPLDPLYVATRYGPRAPHQPSRFPANPSRKGLVAGAAARTVAAAGGRARARLSFGR